MTETIIGDRFDLRSLRASDAGLIAHYASDPRIAKMTTAIPHPYPKGAAEAFVAASIKPDAKAETWVIDALKSGGAELVGLISATPRPDDATEVGYWVAPAFWNTGYASEALDLVLTYLRATTSRKIIGHCFQSNPISARVLTKAGFVYRGEGEAYSVANGGMVPDWAYELPA